MSKMKHVEMKVNDILNDVPEARDDDNLLFCEYLKSLDYQKFQVIAEQIREMKVATKFKSVERARRKLQERNPVLRGNVWNKRHMSQADFIKYARENC